MQGELTTRLQKEKTQNRTAKGKVTKKAAAKKVKAKKEDSNLCRPVRLSRKAIPPPDTIALLPNCNSFLNALSKGKTGADLLEESGLNLSTLPFARREAMLRLRLDCKASDEQIRNQLQKLTAGGVKLAIKKAAEVKPRVARKRPLWMIRRP